MRREAEIVAKEVADFIGSAEWPRAAQVAGPSCLAPSIPICSQAAGSKRSDSLLSSPLAVPKFSWPVALTV